MFCFCEYIGADVLKPARSKDREIVVICFAVDSLRHEIMKNTLRLVLLSILLSPRIGVAADRLFVGNLVMVSSQTTRGPVVVRGDRLSIRLDDGQLINATLQKRGELAASSISARYKFGDRVEVTCKSDRYEFELKKIRLLAPGMPEDLNKVMATLYWKKGENLLKTPPAPEWPLTAATASPKSADVERIREVNLRTLAMMPDFVTHERAERTWLRKGAAKSEVDIIESEMTFTGQRSSRPALRVNGKATSVFPPGLYWNIGWGIGFGSELHALFDRNCGTTFEPGKAEEIRGKQLAVYNFHSPPDGCFGPDWMGSWERDTARRGRIWVDSLGHVIQLEIKESPLGEFATLEAKMIWDYVKIGDALHLLPVEDHYVYTMSGLAAGDVWTISVQYSNHQHFQVSTTIKALP